MRFQVNRDVFSEAVSFVVKLLPQRNPQPILAGVLIEQNGRGLSNPDSLTTALQAYLTSASLLAQHKALAALCFDKFRMERCVAAYETMFARVI